MLRKIKERGTLQLWLAALRSGKYPQGTRRLRSSDDKYCCLGVLADVCGVEWKEGAGNEYTARYRDGELATAGIPEGLVPRLGVYPLGEFTFTPELIAKVTERWGASPSLGGVWHPYLSDGTSISVVMNTDRTCTLSVINDAGADFQLIADLIEMIDETGSWGFTWQHHGDEDE